MHKLKQYIARIKEYYEGLESDMIQDRRNHYVTRGDGQSGVFRPNSVDLFRDIMMNIALRRGNVNALEGLVFLDAGCGDSRSLAVASRFGFDSYGLDLEDYLVETSRRACRDLQTIGAIKNPFRVAKGDYLNDESYAALGIGFSDVDYFVHSLNTLTVFDLIKRFAEDAKTGSDLILTGSPGILLFQEEAIEHGLDMSPIYHGGTGEDIQRHYAFLTKG